MCPSNIPYYRDGVCSKCQTVPVIWYQQVHGGWSDCKGCWSSDQITLGTQGPYPYPYRLTMKSDKIDDSCSLSVTNNGKIQTYGGNVTVSIPVGATFSASVSSWTHALIWEGSMLLACDE